MGGAVGVGRGTTVARGTAGAGARLRLADAVPLADGCAVGECDGLVAFAEAEADADADVAAAEADASVVVDDAGVGAGWVLPAPYM